MPRITKITTLPVKKDDKQISTKNIQQSSFIQTMKEGVALGIGSSIGHRIVGFFLGPSHSPTITKINMNKDYDQCMKEYDDESACKRFII